MSSLNPLFLQSALNSQNLAEVSTACAISEHNLLMKPLLNPLLNRNDRALWLSYGLIWLVIWALHVLASLQSDVEQGQWRPAAAAFKASWTLWSAMLLGVFVIPVTQALYQKSTFVNFSLHLLAAVVFSAAWQIVSYAAGYAFYGADYANATLEQTILWRLIWGVAVYGGLVAAFTALLNSKAARLSALAAEQAQSARVRAELSALRGKLNPHFLFNTLNTLIALTRRDPKIAEQNLLRFAGLLRHVLDNQRHGRDRCPLGNEIDFVRDYVELEKLRLGKRLNVVWNIDENALDVEVPALSMQPLVENAIVHGIAPKIEGGTLTISANIQLNADRSETLVLCVADDGQGCSQEQLDKANTGNSTERQGLGVSAVRQRFALATNNQAKFLITTAPAAGFKTTIEMPI
jgi:signal transduction histidine kinase